METVPDPNILLITLDAALQCSDTGAIYTFQPLTWRGWGVDLDWRGTLRPCPFYFHDVNQSNVLFRPENSIEKNSRECCIFRGIGTTGD